jgi:hypothetical protein
MKNSLLRIILLLLIFAILWNCQKVEDQTEILKESLSINEAKDWFIKNLKNESLQSDLFRSNSADSTVFDLKPLLNWDLAELDNDSIWSVVELAWEYQDGFVEIATSEVKQQYERNQTDVIQVQKLVILKNRLTGAIYGFKMLVIPNLSYILSSAENINSNYYLRRDPAFSGLVLFYSVKDEFINGWEYDHGKIISKVLKESSPSEVSTANYHKVSSGFVTYSIETCIYITVSFAGFTSEPNFSHCKTEFFSTYIDDGFSDGGGGGGGVTIYGKGINTNPNTTTTPSDPTSTLADPCAEFQKMIADDALNAKLKEYILKAERDSLEDGYIKTALGSLIGPSERTRTHLSYTSFNDKIIERVHVHPDLSGGTYVFSPQDLLTLHSMFIKGQMFNPATFRYIVVSIYGNGILHITDPVAFKEFGNKYNKETLDNMFKQAYDKDNDITNALKWFLKILKDTNSGLTFSLGEFTMESSEISDIKWTTYQLDSKDNVTNKDCN